MTCEELLGRLRECPLVASVQASEGSPLAAPELLLKLAEASKQEGVLVLRLEGADAIRTVRAGTALPVIGLVKRHYDGSPVYITPTKREIEEIVEAGAEVVALDGTARLRPNGETLGDLIKFAHTNGALVLADIDTPESAQFAVASGADMVSTTLAGYTDEHVATRGPDFEVLRSVTGKVAVPVFAEGRYGQAWQVEAALRIGATAAIVGGALNDPIKQTRALLPHRIPSDDPAKLRIGAVDIGGTWLRFGLFSVDWKLLETDRTPNPPTREERLAWIRERIAESGVPRVGVSTGGIVDPSTGVVWAAKEYLMHDHIGIEFSQRTLGVPTYAYGDGHATAWAHGNLPRFAGRRVPTIAIGTGVGAGFVCEGRLWAGPRGEYPRFNDLASPFGHTYEELLGGIHLTKDPTQEQQWQAIQALEVLLKTIRDLYFADDIVIGGSVGLSPWLAPHVERLGAVPSPLGSDAGMYGAAALALFPGY